MGKMNYRQKKSVKFNDASLVSKIINLNDSTTIGLQSKKWYQKEDLTLFQTQIKRVVKSLRTNDYKRKAELMKDEEEYCTRGIEKYILQNSRKKRQKLHRAFIFC